MNDAMRCGGPTCQTPADWELRDDPTPDDYTHVCTTHVGALLQRDRQTVVTSLVREVSSQ
jgi:hypothetical protein